MINPNPIDINSLYRSNLSNLKKRVEGTARAEAGQTQGTINKNSKLYKSSREFEAIFIKQMLTTMRKTVTKSGLLNGGQAEEIFEDMLYDKYAMKMSENANFGLADTLYKQLAAGVPESDK